MANPTPDKSIDPRILDSARKEFTEKGFKATSLKDICKNAGVTTGALYKRYSGKEKLFHAVVENTINDLNQIMDKNTSFDLAKISDDMLCDMCNLSKNEERTMQLLKFLYERRSDMFLLLACSDGSQYADFQHDWVEKIMEKNYSLFEELQRRGLVKYHASRQELHILLSAFWQALYEPLIHQASWEEMEEHCGYISRFFNWPNALGFTNK